MFAACLESGVPGALAIEAIDPEVPEEVRIELARRWEDDRKVRAARFDAREWVRKNVPEKIDAALLKTRTGMAAFLMMTNVAEAKDAVLSKALKFVEALEKVQAGTAGKSDASSEFFRKVMAGEIKLVAGGAKDARVQ